MWFKRLNWLHYDESQDASFCFPCLKALKEKKLTRANPDKALISNGFANWKDACVKFNMHEQSSYHKESIEKNSNVSIYCKRCW